MELIKTNTFGCELEFAEANKSDILVPKGFGWTKNEFTTFFSTAGERVTTKSECGGELNTRPILFTDDNLKELEAVVKSIEDAGGYILWDINWHIHIDISKFDLEACKKLYTLIYKSYSYMKTKFKLPLWYQTPYLAPAISVQEYRRMQRVETMKDFDSSFVNGSNRGYIRHYISMSSRGRLGTVEFRTFAGTFEFEKFKYCIESAYRFVQLSQDLSMEEIEHLTDEKLEELLPVDDNLVPVTNKPLLWADDFSNNVTVIGDSFKKNSELVGYVVNAVKERKRVHVVNSMLMDIEQALLNKEVTLYTKSYFTYLVYKIINDDYIFSLAPEYAFMEIEKGDKAERLAKLFLFNTIRKSMNSKSYYAMMQFKDYQDRYDYYVQKAKKQTERIVSRLENKVTVVYGDVLDAMAACQDDEVVLYQSEFNIHLKANDNALRKMGTIELDLPKLLTDYSKVDLETVPYVVVTTNSVLGLHKVYRGNRVYAYSNLDTKPMNRFKGRDITALNYPRLPDNYEITPKSTIKFIRAQMSEVDYLRMQYMKKDIMLGSAPFCYLWFLDDYLIGACMFDFSKQSVGGGDKVWLKSDFVIDSDFDKLSKLLIMALTSTEFKKELDVRYKTNVEVITTTVFTDSAVSMKYRGVFYLEHREAGKLYYDQVAGVGGTSKNIVQTFISKHRKAKKK